MEVSEKTTNNVLVTGADNGAGRAIAKRLVASGYTVTGTVTTAEQAIAMRQEGVLPAYPVLLRAGEIRSVIKAAGADIIVHAATQAYNQVPQLKTDWDAALKLVKDLYWLVLIGTKWPALMCRRMSLSSHNCSSQVS